MIIATLPLQDGAIHYTRKHNDMSAAQVWAAWKNGEMTVFHVTQWQNRHGGYFTPAGEFIRGGREYEI